MKRAVLIRGLLVRWFRREARDLPWRRTRDPYAIWVSEIMLQQTRVDQATPYYERFIAAFPTVQALASATEDRVLKRWEGLGYYTRARNLHKAAKTIVAAHRGQFPRTAAEWQRLPGVGRYTANAVASIAFGECVPVVDGNVQRVLARVFDVAACIDETRTQQRLWALADSLVSPKSPGESNQALMELGARICLPRQPHCAVCPLRNQCDARGRGVEAQRPVRRAKKRVPHQDMAVAAIRRHGRYLIGKRPPGGLLGGLWEFPGTRVEADDVHSGSLERVARDEWGITIRVGPPIATVAHAYSHFRVTLYVYRCALLSGKPEPGFYTEFKWAFKAHLARYALPKANHKFLASL